MDQNQFAGVTPQGNLMMTQKGLSGAVLKWIAIITMVIDHFGASIMEKYLYYSEQGWILWENNPDLWTKLSYVDAVIRRIGRAGFPLFAFLLVEGFFYTRNRGKYIARLTLFAAISEFPFDMAILEGVWNNSHQNVFFTLALGLCCIWAIDSVWQRFGTTTGKKILEALVNLVIIVAFAAVAELLNTDYSAVGICVLVIIYGCRRMPQKGMPFENRRKQNMLAMFLGVLVLSAYNFMEAWAFVDLIFVYFYNGTRGKQNRYLFYIIYPAHLLLYALIGYAWLGIF